MKKFLLSCFVAMGIGANAQITVNESWENATAPGFTTSGGYTGSTGVYNITPQSCDGTKALGTNMYGGTSGGRSFTVTYTVNPSASNAKAIDYSFDWQILDSGFGGTVSGSFQVAYNRSATGTTGWVNLGPAVSFSALTGCTTQSGTIEASTSSTTGVPANSPFRFRVVVTTTNNSSYDYLWLIDNFKLAQKTDTPPACTTVTLPADGANPNDKTSVSWTSTPGASSYKVYVGDSAGNYNIANGTSVTGTSYTIPAPIPNTTYYVKIIPTNTNGDASGCTESSFTTGAAGYCSIKATANSSLDYISNVTYEGIANTTTVTTGSYRDYSAQKAVVKREDTKVLSVTIATDPDYPNTDFLSAYIDWNNDKDFNDSGEQIMLQPSVSAGTYTANVTVPSDAVLGDTKMRVLVEYNGSSTYVPTACNLDFAYGEAEDYIVTVEPKETMAVSDVNKANVSVYPNPFTDVLKISNVKGVKSVSINDVSGREVKSLAPSAELNLSNLKAGLYIVNLKMEDGSVKTFKAIKK